MIIKKPSLQLGEDVSKKVAHELFQGSIGLGNCREAYLFHRQITQRQIEDGLNFMNPYRLAIMCEHSGYTTEHQDSTNVEKVGKEIFCRKKEETRQLLEAIQNGYYFNSCKLISILVQFELAQQNIDTMLRDYGGHSDLCIVEDEEILDPHTFLYRELKMQCSLNNAQYYRLLRYLLGRPDPKTQLSLLEISPPPDFSSFLNTIHERNSFRIKLLFYSTITTQGRKNEYH